MFSSRKLFFIQFKFDLDKPNITKGTCTPQGDSVTLKFDVFLYDDSPALDGVYWTKKALDGKIHNLKSNKRYGVDTNNPHHPSLTIKDVKSEDAGFYWLTAANPVGETQSEAIVLGNSTNHLINVLIVITCFHIMIQVIRKQIT